MIIPAANVLKSTRLPLVEDIQYTVDQRTEDYIKIGLGLQQSYGTSCAIEYLQGKGVPNRITEQVLVRSNQSR
ncbi:hypothetical protein [Undibacterium sp. RuRC25W]|uniref:hypothetical protein n=1 Tax=Undibacterium sp. RuRC25W TaxID=3413047 RepID=UPI003BF3EAA4